LVFVGAYAKHAPTGIVLDIMTAGGSAGILTKHVGTAIAEIVYGGED
jgi:hypothetical protein